MNAHRINQGVIPDLRKPDSSALLSLGGESRHRQHRGCPVSAAGSLIKTKITGLAIACE
jgi:hypothetical protein